MRHLDLAAEDQHLSLQFRLVAVAGRDHVQQDAHQRIPERAHHPGAQSYPCDATWRSRNFNRRSPPDEFDVIFEPHSH